MFSLLKINVKKFIFTLVIAFPSLSLAEDTQTQIPFVEQVSFESLSGIYVTYRNNEAWYISVHIKDDEITVTDLNEHFSLLLTIGYLTESDVEQGVKLSAPDRVFYGKRNAIEPTTEFYTGYLNPILPAGSRASSASATYPAATEEPIKCADVLHNCGDDGTFMNFSIYSLNEQPQLSLHRYNLFIYADFGDYVKVF